MEDVLETRDRDDPWTKERKTNRITKHICTSETHHSRLVPCPPCINPTHSLFLPVLPLHSPVPLPEACAHKDKTLERSSCGATGTSLSFTPVMTHWSQISNDTSAISSLSTDCKASAAGVQPTGSTSVWMESILNKTGRKSKLWLFWQIQEAELEPERWGGGGGNDRALWLLLSRTKCWVDDVTFVLSG